MADVDLENLLTDLESLSGHWSILYDDGETLWMVLLAISIGTSHV